MRTDGSVASVWVGPACHTPTYTTQGGKYASQVNFNQPNIAIPQGVLAISVQWELICYELPDNDRIDDP